MRILIVEDDGHLAQTLARGLEEARYAVSHCATLTEARRRLREESIDLLLLDLGLKDGDGMDLLQTLRTEGRGLPILIITARDAISDRVEGFEAGADDYLVKPFAFAELLARIRARLSRPPARGETRIDVEDLSIDLLRHEVRRAGRGVDLTPHEYAVLLYLAQRAGKIVSREMLATDVWKVRSRATPLDNVIDVHMSHLREKIDRGSDRPLIATVRGMGFRLGGET